MKRVLLFISGLVLTTFAIAQTTLQPGAYTAPKNSVVTPTGGSPVSMPQGGTVEVPVAQYATRCEELKVLLGSNFVNCWDFETVEQSKLRTNMPNLQYRPAVTIDYTMAASGKGSLRFETISYNEAKARCPECTHEQILATARASNTSWWARNFKDDLSFQVGLGQEFWIQMRIRENDAFYGGDWGGDGPKKWIIGIGDRNIEYRFKIGDPLPASSGAGTVVRLLDGDNPDLMPNAGKMTIGEEVITYRGLDRAANTIIIHYRSKPVDHQAGTVALMQDLHYAPGCPDVDIPITHGWNYLPEAYTSCGVKDRAYAGFSLPLRNPASGFTYDWIKQSGRPGTWNDTLKKWEGGCYLNKIKVGDYSGCIVDKKGEGWNTWTINVKVHQTRWYQNDKRYEHLSTVRIWKNGELHTDNSPDNQHPRSDAMSREQCLAEPHDRPDGNKCLTGTDFARLPASISNASLSGPRSAQDEEVNGGGKFGMIHINLQSWRRQYEDQTSPQFCCHPIVMRWFDDLVISKGPIPLPDGTPLRLRDGSIAK